MVYCTVACVFVRRTRSSFPLQQKWVSHASRRHPHPQPTPSRSRYTRPQLALAQHGAYTAPARYPHSVHALTVQLAQQQVQPDHLARHPRPSKLSTNPSRVCTVATRSRNAVPPFCTRDPPAIPSHPTPAGGARLSCVCVATCVRRHLRYPSLQPQAAGPRLHAWPCSPGSSLSPPLSLLRPPVRRLHMGLRAVYYQRGSRHLRVTASSARGASAVRGRASP